MELVTRFTAVKFVIEMKIQFFIYFLAVIISLCCTDSSRQTNQLKKKVDRQTPVKNKPGSSFSDTIKINSFAAVLYHPDSIQIEKIKSITDTGIFESTMHEYFYLMRYSRIVLTKYYPDIEIIEVKNARHLIFEKPGGRKECIDLNTKNDPWGIFIFDRKKAPRLVDMTNIETELGFYFVK